MLIPSLTNDKSADLTCFEPLQDPASRLVIRYKDHTSSKAEYIGAFSPSRLQDVLRLRFADGCWGALYDFSQYHVSLLWRMPPPPKPRQSWCAGIYKTEEDESPDDSKATRPQEERALLWPCFDIDVKDSLVDALMATRQACRTLESRGLQYRRDYYTYFTGSKGFRVVLMGLTRLAQPRFLSEGIKLWIAEHFDAIADTVDLGIYNPSQNAGFVRGPGSYHPEAKRWSIPLSRTQLFQHSPDQAIHGILRKSRKTPGQATSFLKQLTPKNLLPFEALEPDHKTSAGLATVLGEIESLTKELELLALLEQRTLGKSTEGILDLRGLCEAAGAEIQGALYEGRTLKLKQCPQCGKPDKAWITPSGRLFCWVDHCEASRGSGGLSAKAWSGLEIESFRVMPALEPLEILEHPELKKQVELWAEDTLERLDQEAFLAQFAGELWRFPTGSRKSWLALAIALRATMFHDKQVVLSVPNHVLARQTVERLQILGSREAQALGGAPEIFWWRGRGQPLPGGPSEAQMCSRTERLDKAQELHLNPMQYACRGCPLRHKGCAYLGQYSQLDQWAQEEIPFVIVATHDALWSLAERWQPDLLILDEDVGSAAVKHYTITQNQLTKPFAEPQGLLAPLQDDLQPILDVLAKTMEKVGQSKKHQLQREIKKKLRQAAKRGDTRPVTLPKDCTVFEEGLFKWLMFGMDEGQKQELLAAFIKARAALLAARHEFLEQPENLQKQWSQMLPFFGLLELLEAFTAKLHQELGQEDPRHQNQGWSMALQWELSLDASKPVLQGGRFLLSHARSLPWQAPKLALDATAEALPWEVYLGGPLQVKRFDVKLNPQSDVVWIKLATLQSALLEGGQAYIRRHLLPWVQWELEQGRKVLIGSWLKPQDDGSSYQQLLIQTLEEAGLAVDGKQLDVIHFYGQRGQNHWRDWDTCVMWGMPVENLDALALRHGAMADLLADEFKAELYEQMMRQSTQGEALQLLGRVGAVEGQARYIIFGQERRCPMLGYLEAIAHPGQFRQLDAREVACDPEVFGKHRWLIDRLREIGFFSRRLVGGLLGLDPVATHACVRRGWVKREELRVGVEAQRCCGILDKEKGERERSGSLINREATTSLSRKAMRDFEQSCEGRRLFDYLKRLFDGDGFETFSREDSCGNYRTDHLRGNLEAAREFTSFCDQIEEAWRREDLEPAEPTVLPGSEESNTTARMELASPSSRASLSAVPALCPSTWSQRLAEQCLWERCQESIENSEAWEPLDDG